MHLFIITIYRALWVALAVGALARDVGADPTRWMPHIFRPSEHRQLMRQLRTEGILLRYETAFFRGEDSFRAALDRHPAIRRAKSTLLVERSLNRVIQNLYPQSGRFQCKRYHTQRDGRHTTVFAAIDHDHLPHVLDLGTNFFQLLDPTGTYGEGHFEANRIRGEAHCLVRLSLKNESVWGDLISDREISDHLLPDRVLRLKFSKLYNDDPWNGE